MKKRVLALILMVAILLPATEIHTATAEGGDTFEVSEYADTIPIKDGCVFAGWYTDGTFTTPYTADSGMATAKFVSKDVLSVKFQINDGTDADSASTRLRIVTTVDGLDYRSVGFVVQFAGETARELTTHNVYRRLIGYDGVSSLSYSPTYFDAQSRYFCAYNFTVPNSKFGADFTVTPLWITPDGTRVTGEQRTIRIADCMSYAVPATVIGYELTGTWAIDRVNGTGASTTFAPLRSFDGDVTTYWNPQATDYVSGEGIVYRLDQAYDLTEIQLTFSRIQFFDLYVSSDGTNYELAHQVTRANAGYYYSNNVCTVTGLQRSNVMSVKIIFTGSSGGERFISVYEAVFTGLRMAVGTDDRPETGVNIVSHALLGTWQREYTTGHLPDAGYDGSMDTFWNPMATDYTAGEGVVYTLGRASDLTEITLAFRSNDYYFDLYVSPDGESYTLARSVRRENAGQYYADHVCTIRELRAFGAGYIKIVFTGSSTGTFWISLNEITVTGKEPEEEMDSGGMVQAQIVAHGLLGNWVTDRVTSGASPALAPDKSYDGDSSTGWNPQASAGYASGEGIVYTLDQAYDLSTISLTFTARDMYFTLSVSSDGEAYTELLTVNSANAAVYYADHVFTGTDLSALSAQYIKLLFTGSSDGGLWVNLREVVVIGREPAAPEEPEMPEDTAPAITDYDTGAESTWAKVGSTNRMADKSVDGNAETSWNASIKKDVSAVVYSLDGIYSLTGAVLTWDRATTWFDFYVSFDGENWTAVASVTSDSGHYNGNVSILDGLNTVAASYIKLVFTGDSGTWFSLYEIELTGIPVVSAGITGHQPVGAWVKEFTTGHPPTHSYDGDGATMWNPQASALYGSGEGVIYRLDGAYDLTELRLTFSVRDYYFDLYVSPDGKSYTKLISVTADNASTYYTDHVFTAAELASDSTRYIKLLFTGSSDGGLYVALYEIAVFGRVPELPVELGEESAPVTAHDLTGTWVKDYTTGHPPTHSYDGNDATMWNPQAAAGYSGAPGIIYTLQEAYDLTRLTLTFTNRLYYFDLYVSAYGGEYTLAARINASNAAAYYTDYVCTVDCSTAQNVKYIKLVFTGSGGDGSLYVGLYEFSVQGCRAGDTADLSARINATAQLEGTDSLGRTVDSGGEARNGKEVGVFYFLWLGAYYSEGPYDVSAVKAANPNAAVSNEAWLAAGGGAVGQRHWWGQPLFGYYRSDDAWVVERDVQMLTDAGVDFLALDYSNASEYPRQLLTLLAALDKYDAQGFSVPRITFITKASSGEIVMDLYENFYLGHPEYAHLWYRQNGKPLMIGVQNSAAVTEDCAAYFTWRYPQWPREAYQQNGFPWLDFGSWTQSGKPAVFGGDGSATVMSVSVAQHSGTLAFSSSALYGDNTNHTRSYHNGANDTAEDAALYGYNFAEQFEYAIEQDPDIIFVTGWNEWIAARQSSWNGITDPVILVDNCDINNSRDIQPMKGGYGDNYYMQLVSYIRQYKGLSLSNRLLNTAAPVTDITIDVGGSFDQWNAVRPFYLDYTGDTTSRNHAGFGSLVYTDDTGRNDLYKMKMANDEANLYAYAETVEDITGMDDGQCMTLFLSTGGGGPTWCGYDYAVNRTAAGSTLAVERWTGTAWEQVGTADYTCAGNRLQLAVSLSTLGLTAGDIDVQFKWTDNYQEEDVYNFYLHGDAAPYGRLNYVYQNAEA